MTEPKTTLQSEHPLGKVLRRIERDRPTLYEPITVDLSVARDLSAGTYAFETPGDTLAVVSITGTATIIFQDKTMQAVSLAHVRRFVTPFKRFWIINTAQAGKSITILVGRDASFEGIPNPVTTIVDTNAVNINPAEMSTTPAIYNVTMTLADTEYSQLLPDNTKKFLIKTTDGTAFRIAFVTGKVAVPTAPYWTVPTSNAYSEDGVKLTAATIYFACSGAGKIAEIVSWS